MKSDPCPSPDVWIALLRRAELPRRESILEHLAGCASCREEVIVLLPAETSPDSLPDFLKEKTLRTIHAAIALRPPARIDRWRTWASVAAAALLVTLGAWSWSARREGAASCFPPLAPRPGGGQAPPPLPAPGSTWRCQRTQHVVLGHAVAARLEAGGTLRWLSSPSEPGISLLLESGRLLIETPGEPVHLKLGTMTVECEDADFLAAWSPGRMAQEGWLMRSAWAEDEGACFVRVLRGVVRLRIGQGLRREVGSGQEIRADGSLTVAPVEGIFHGGMPLEDRVQVLKDGVLRFETSPTRDYRYEVLLRKRDTSAECAVGFTVSGTGYEMPLAGALAGTGWTRVMVQVEEGWCQLLAGSRCLISCPVGDLKMKAYPSSQEGLWVRGWGGDVEIGKASRWLLEPAESGRKP